MGHLNFEEGGRRACLIKKYSCLTQWAPWFDISTNQNGSHPDDRTRGTRLSSRAPTKALPRAPWRRPWNRYQRRAQNPHVYAYDPLITTGTIWVPDKRVWRNKLQDHKEELYERWIDSMNSYESATFIANSGIPGWSEPTRLPGFNPYFWYKDCVYGSYFDTESRTFKLRDWASQHEHGSEPPPCDQPPYDPAEEQFVVTRPSSAQAAQSPSATSEAWRVGGSHDIASMPFDGFGVLPPRRPDPPYFYQPPQMMPPHPSWVTSTHPNGEEAQGSYEPNFSQDYWGRNSDGQMTLDEFDAHIAFHERGNSYQDDHMGYLNMFTYTRDKKRDDD
ncbi:hypothetical protein BX600DRAFT_513034 [Xylariales sp. PMI_506]|nr:hypothetical protein BX600DRAFT_513034 [Xylariales sp. PMI_506]